MFNLLLSPLLSYPPPVSCPNPNTPFIFKQIHSDLQAARISNALFPTSSPKHGADAFAEMNAPERLTKQRRH